MSFENITFGLVNVENFFFFDFLMFNDQNFILVKFCDFCHINHVVVVELFI